MKMKMKMNVFKYLEGYFAKTRVETMLPLIYCSRYLTWPSYEKKRIIVHKHTSHPSNIYNTPNCLWVTHLKWLILD
jgi:hypothetical protein